MNWHNFFFAAFDPAATISIDKLPGAFWIQALSVRIFGAHTWALALPQVIEGVLSVLVLHRAVRRCAGPVAGIIAAGVLGFSPATVTLNRGNVADSLLVLLLVLAADSLVSSLRTGRFLSLVVAGVWVGLAFQAKMLEAWLVLPALAFAYLIAADARLSTRITRVAGMLAIAVLMSLSWIAVVSMVPHEDRPYADGSANDSLASQVFDYNGFGRVGRPDPNQVLGRTLGISFLAGPAPPASGTRLLEGAPGRDTGWLLPASLIVIPVLLWSRRRDLRTDPLRSSVVLWGCWLLIFAIVFSISPINWYYLGALSPPIAALLGIAAGQAWVNRTARFVQAIVVGIVGVSVAYVVWLLPSSGTGVAGWIEGVTLALGFLSVAAISVFAMTGGTSVGFAGAFGTIAAILAVPVIASISVVINNLGAFDTPFQPAALTAFNRSFFGAPLQPIASLHEIERVRDGAPDLLATQTSVIAAPFIFATGQEVLPIGGYDGSTPEPTLAMLRTAIADGAFHLVLTASHSDDARALFIQRHCLAVHPTNSPPLVSLRVSYCLPADAK